MKHRLITPFSVCFFFLHVCLRASLHSSMFMYGTMVQGTNPPTFFGNESHLASSWHPSYHIHTPNPAPFCHAGNIPISTVAAHMQAFTSDILLQRVELTQIAVQIFWVETKKYI